MKKRVSRRRDVEDIGRCTGAMMYSVFSAMFERAKRSHKIIISTEDKAGYQKKRDALLKIIRHRGWDKQESPHKHIKSSKRKLGRLFKSILHSLTHRWTHR